MRTYPNKVMTFWYNPDATLVLGVVKLKDVVGALSEAVSIVAKMGLDLRMSSAYSLSRGEIAIWSFMGIAPQDFDTERLEKTLSASPMVLEYQMRRGDRGLISNTLQFPVWSRDNRKTVLFSPETLNGIFARVKTLFGTGGDVIVYEEGKCVQARVQR